jgi:hypothetical protein
MPPRRAKKKATETEATAWTNVKEKGQSTFQGGRLVAPGKEKVGIGLSGSKTSEITLLNIRDILTNILEGSGSKTQSRREGEQRSG